MARALSHIPEGFHSLTPHLHVKGAAKFLDFLKNAFGAVEVGRTPGPQGKVMHAEVRIGDSILMINDEFPEFGGPSYAGGPWPVVLHIYVPDADAAFAQATAAGCEVSLPLADQFWGDRYGQLRDPFGFTWAIATRKEDLTREDLRERQSKMFGSTPI
jgi:uncharacterized glyoxalase superfamily protein PhnB